MENWLKVSPSSGEGDSELNNSSSLHKGREKRIASVVAYVPEIDSANAYSVSQEPSEEYIILDKSSFDVSEELSEIVLTGKSNSPKLSFTLSEDSDISLILDGDYIVNGYLHVANSKDIPNDVGAKGEYYFSMKVTVPKNNVGERSGRIIVTGSSKSIKQEVEVNQEISTHKISYFKNDFIATIEKTSEVLRYGETATNVATIPANNEQYTYSFDGWYENNKKIGSSLTLSLPNIDTDKSIFAIAKRVVNNYSLDFSINPIGTGTVSGGGTYPYNSRVRIYAVPKEGYDFIKYVDEEENEFTENPYFIDVRKNRSIVAVFRIKTYSIILKNEYRIKESGSYISGDIGGTVSGQNSATHGQSVTLVASPNTGYEFVGWYEGSNRVSDKISYSFRITSNKNIVARFQRKWFTIKFVAGVGGRVEPTEDRVEYGGSTTSLAIPSSGSNFQNWSNGSLSERINILNVTSDATYSASFGEKLYTINYSKGEGIESISSDSETVYHGNSAIGSIAIVEEGYIFDGWYENGVKVSSELLYAPKNVSRNINVVAKAIIKKFNILYTPYYRDTDNIGSFVYGNKGGNVSGSGIYNYGSFAQLIAVPNEGYDFVGWYNSEGGEISTESNYDILSVTENVTVYPRFQRKWFTVQYITGVGVEELNKKSDRVFYGGTVSSERIVVSPNYNSPEWKLDSGQAVLNVSNLVATLLNIKSDCQLTASASINGYKISYSKNENIATIEKTSEEVNYGGTASNVATIPNNTVQYTYSFDGWYDGATRITDELVLSVPNISSSRLFTAKGNRVLNTYDVTVTNGSGSGNYGYGTRVTLTANSIPGKTFVQWSDGVKTSSREVIVTGDKTYEAQFKDNIYTINYIIGEGVSALSISSEEVKYGEDAVGCTATVMSGYFFEGWYSGSNKISSSITYALENVTSNISLTAIAKLITYNVEADAYYRDSDGTGEYILGDTGGTVSGGGTINYGRDTVLIASPKEGYKFDGWFTVGETGGELISSSLSYFIDRVVRDVKVYARFSKKYFSINYKKGDNGIVSLSRDSERVAYGEDAIGCTMTLKENTPEYSYSVDGWYNSGGALVSSDNEYVPQRIMADLTFTAKSKSVLNGVIVNYVKGDNILSLNRSTEVVIYGGDALGCIATLPPKDEEFYYTFDGWYEGDVKVSSSLNFYPKNVIKGTTYEARGIKNDNIFEINVALDSLSVNKGTVSGGGTYNYGDEVTVVCELSKEEYIFDGWYENDEKVSSEKSYTFTVNNNRNLYAKILYLEINPTELIFDSSGGSKSIRISSSTGFTVS